MPLLDLNQVRSVMKEPQLLHRWSIDIPQYPRAAAPSNKNLLILTTSAALPEAPEYENVQIKLATHTMNYNGNQSRNGRISLTLYENLDHEVEKYFFVDYQNKRKNFSSNASMTGEASDSADLIAPIVNMNLLSNDGKRITRTYQLINVMFEIGSLGGELGQEAVAQQPQVVFTYDAWLPA